jgi:GTP cyclohydrolase I
MRKPKNNPKTNADIPDIQAGTTDFHKKYIPKVGTRDACLPVKIVRKDGTVNEGSGKFSMYSDLSADNRGSHMSRYRLLIEEVVQKDSYFIHDVIKDLLTECKQRLNSDNAYVKIKFDYFLKRKAPVSGVTSHMDYRGNMEGRLINGKQKLYLTVHVMYASLCPCSKEISNYGAHNQRSVADVTVELDESKGIFYIEDLIDIVEQNASAPIINALKRVDEAWQTELMYENPVFVEDIVRNIAVDLDKELENRILDYSVVVNHYESIHTSVACAFINAGRDLK